MDVIIDKERARALVGDRVMWPLVRDFLWRFPSQVHVSWLEDLEREAMDVRRGELLASPHVRRFVMSRLGLEACFHDFPKDDASRLLLLDGQTLLSAAKWLGALAAAQLLRLVTSAKDVRELKSEFAGIYPEVFGFTPYFHDLGKEDVLAGRDAASGSLADAVVALGHRILAAQVEKLPKELYSRFKYKFPKAVAESVPPCEVDVGISSVYLLFKLRFPEAYRLCCS